MRTSSETILLALALVATAVKAELKVEVYDGPKECEDDQKVKSGSYLSMVNIPASTLSLFDPKIKI